MRRISKSFLFRKLLEAFQSKKVLRETLVQTVAMYYMMRDPQVGVGVKTQVVAALAYLLNPFDLIPDFLPTGLVDDVALIGYTWSLIQHQLRDEHLRRSRGTVTDLLGRLGLTKEVTSP